MASEEKQDLKVNEVPMVTKVDRDLLVWKEYLDRKVTLSFIMFTGFYQSKIKSLLWKIIYNFLYISVLYCKQNDKLF